MELEGWWLVGEGGFQSVNGGEEGPAHDNDSGIF